MGKAIKEIFEPLEKVFKLFKYFGLDMLAMVGTLGAFKAALLLGQGAIKAWNFSLAAMGAAAGAAVAALAGVLGAMRELQLAQLKPLLSPLYPGTGAESPAARISGIARDRRLAMYGGEATAAVGTYARAGIKVDANQLARIGDFTAGDPKSFARVTKAMASAQKAGKVTANDYQDFQKYAPGLAAAFEELAGGAKNAENATISFDTFNKALQEGKLKSLEPYNGALNEINNTLIGKFKGGLAVLKESLTVLGSTSWKELYGAKSPYSGTTGTGTGMSMVDAAKAPLDQLVQSIQGMLNAIGPSILRVFPQMTQGLADPLSKAMERMTYWIVEGIDKLDGFSASLSGIIGKTRMVFSAIAAYVTKAAAPFDSLWKNFIVPLGEGIGSLLNSAVEHFGEVADENANALAEWGQAIKGILTNLGGLFKALGTVKTVLAPLITALLKVFEIFSKLFLGNAIGQSVVAIGLIVAALTKIVRTFNKMQTAAIEAMAETRKAIFKTASSAKSATSGLPGGYRQSPNYPGYVIGPNGMHMPASAIPPATGANGAAGFQVGKLREWRKEMAAWKKQGGFSGAMHAMISGNAAQNGGRRLFSKDSLLGGGAMTAAGMGATVLGSYVTSKASPTDARGMGIGGALTGAGTGAMIGTMIAPGIGTAVGAAAGAALGGVMSAFQAKSARERRQDETAATVRGQLLGKNNSRIQSFRDEARANARAFEIYRMIDEKRALDRKSDDVGGLSADEKSRLASLKRQIKRYGGSDTGAARQAEKILAGSGERTAKLTANKAIGSLFGFDMQELGDYARKHNKSLASAVLNLKDFIKLVGYSGKLNKDGTATLGDLSVASERAYKRLTDVASSAKAVAQSGIDAVNRMTQFINEGKTGQSADQSMYNAADTVETIVARQTARMSAGMFEGAGGGYQGFVDQTKQYLVSFYEGAKRSGVTDANLQALLAQIMPVIAKLDQSTTNLRQRLEADPTLSGRLNDLVDVATAKFIELGPKATDAERNKLLDDQTAKILWELGSNGIAIDENTISQVKVMLAGSIDGPDGAGAKMTQALVTGGDAVARAIKGAFGASKLGYVVTVNGEKLRVEIGGVKIDGTSPKASGGDTATPRFARTMARHAALNGLVSGKRTITSGIRGNNLGSIGSDHRFGYAYDLVGQNLGAYAANVKRSGGFAEFHGAGGTRHLHVVPGMGAIGDTASPIGPIGGGMTGVSIGNVNITVNAAPGQNEEAIADAVMVRIGRAQRDAVERR